MAEEMELLQVRRTANEHSAKHAARLQGEKRRCLRLRPESSVLRGGRGGGFCGAGEYGVAYCWAYYWEAGLAYDGGGSSWLSLLRGLRLGMYFMGAGRNRLKLDWTTRPRSW